MFRGHNSQYFFAVFSKSPKWTEVVLELNFSFVVLRFDSFEKAGTFQVVQRVNNSEIVAKWTSERAILLVAEFDTTFCCIMNLTRI